jgi:hypothetical protein
LAFERGGRRAILGKPSTALVNQSAGGRICGQVGPSVEPDRSNNLIEATTMSHTCATKKTIAPFRKYSDFLKRGGVYEKIDRITSILPGKLGNGKNAGG